MKILLLGDSITGYMPNNLLDCEWNYNLKKDQELGVNHKYYKAAVENYTTDMLRQYVFDKIDTTPYDIIVLQCGINDFLRPRYDENCKAKSLQEIYIGLTEFLTYIKEKTGAKVVFQSIYPTRNMRIGHLNSNIVKLNIALKGFCCEKGMAFCDIYSYIANTDGELNQKFSDDGLHPNEEGYKLISKVIEGKVNNLEQTKE